MDFLNTIGNFFSDIYDYGADMLGGESSVQGIGPVADGSTYAKNISGMGPVVDGNVYGDYLKTMNAPSAPVTPGSSGSGKDVPFYKDPAILGSIITSGAGLFNNMSALDAKKQSEKNAQEQQKLQALLSLAQLKHSILAKEGQGGARSGGARASDVNRQNSVNYVNALNNLGTNMANIYKG